MTTGSGDRRRQHAQGHEVRELSARERAELQRQGAKAAARGDAADVYAGRRRADDALAQRGHVGAQQHEAWQSGYEAQQKVRRSARPDTSEPDSELGDFD